MKIFFNLDENNRLDGWSSTSTRQENEVELVVADDHEVLNNPFVFKYENGELVKDEEYQQKLIKQEEEKKNKLSDTDMNAIAIMELTEMIMKGGK